jgi:hypothetical protein
MTTTEALTQQTLRELAETAGPWITLVLAGNEAGDTATELKEQLRKLRQELTQRGFDPEPLLAQIDDAGRNVRGETKSLGSIAILRSPSEMRLFRVSRSVGPIACVGDRVHLRTLLSIMESRKLFYIIALSQNRTRFLKCTESTSEEVLFPAGFPASLADAMQTRTPDHVLDNRSSAGPSTGSMGGVMFGTSTDRENKDEYMLHFFMQLDKAANTLLKGSRDPLIAAGVEHEIALYRRVNTYPHLVEPGVHGAADGLEGGEMHARALDLLAQQFRQPGNEVPADFDKRVGTGHASTHIQEIIAGAAEGRVSHFFFQPTAQYTGTFDPVRQRVKHTHDPLSSPQDLVEGAAWETILHGGEARILPGAAMPNGVPVCALFRYPLPAGAGSVNQVETAV